MHDWKHLHRFLYIGADLRGDVAQLVEVCRVGDVEEPLGQVLRTIPPLLSSGTAPDRVGE